MCEPDANVAGQPQGPTTTGGFTDGSCCKLTAPTEGETRQRAAARKGNVARIGPRPEANDPDARSSLMLLLFVSES